MTPKVGQSRRDRVAVLIEQVCDPEGLDCHWVIQPNCSLPWRVAVRVYIAITVCCLGIGVAFALHGFWPVLPFAGLEVAVLGAAFYLCHQRAMTREVISVSGDVVIVEKGRREPEHRWECPRAWAQVRLEPSAVNWYPSRLTLAYHGKRVEIGHFLNEQERRSLAADLKAMIGRRDWHR